MGIKEGTGNTQSVKRPGRSAGPESEKQSAEVYFSWFSWGAKRGLETHKAWSGRAVSRAGIAKAVRNRKKKRFYDWEAEARGKRQEARGKRQEARGKRQRQRQRQRQRHRQMQPWLSKHVLESHDGTYWTRRRCSACRTGDRKQTKFYTVRMKWLF